MHCGEPGIVPPRPIVPLPWNSRKKSRTCPLEAGVYLFKDALGTILYVGKARSLRSRVRSYFLESSWANAKTGSLVREIADFDYIVVDNEREALALENSLIKQNQPKFNVLLRDDKTYPYIRYTAFEKYPRVYVTRHLRKDGSLYFGPYFPHSLALPHRAFHSQTLSRAILHRGPYAESSPALLAVLHSPLPGALRHRAYHRRALRRSGARYAKRSSKAAATTSLPACNSA